MQVVLCALNAKYIHTNLAVRYIESYVKQHEKNARCHIVEETIHTEKEKVLSRILEYHPAVVAFSCYIWNMGEVLSLCDAIRKKRPDIVIVLGGPEVSYEPERFFFGDYADYIIRGEGEKPMATLLSALSNQREVSEGFGICTAEREEDLYVEQDLNNLENPYTDEYLSAVSGRLAYFEASRGCPFSCAFCLSGGCGGVRNFPMEYVKKNLLALWNSGVKTVKFVDRTFNANQKRADEIISFLLENAPHMPKVCFHFEVAADILAESTLELLSQAPKGLFQIEAGIQSFNEKTLLAISRKNSLEKVCKNVQRILSFGNIHTHIDLIAGLPYEGMESFRESFNRGFSVGAHMLQLGFLKLLYGSRLRQEQKQHGFLADKKAPYTVRATKWLSEKEMCLLEHVEDANEKIANSHRFERSLAYVLEVSGITPFDLFSGFGKKDSMPLDSYTDELFHYFASLPGVDAVRLRDFMCMDRFASNNSGKLPRSLKVKDERLGDFAHVLEQTREKGVKRAVCILYSEKKVLYADYRKGEDAPFALCFKDISELEKVE